MTPTAALIERLVPAGAIHDGDTSALDWLSTRGLPDPREEAWRYTPVAEVVSSLQAAVPATQQLVERNVVDALAGDHGGPRIVIVNGVYAPALSDLDRLRPGLWCGRLADLSPTQDAAPRWRDAALLVDGFQALNHIAGADGAAVLIDAGAQPPDPVHIVHVTSPGERAAVSHPRTVIDAGESSQVHVIETFCGLPGAAFTNASATLRIGRGADVTHHRIQAEAAATIHIGHTRVDQAAESRLHASSVMFGADIARHAIEVVLHGPDASVDLDGLYLPTGHQRHDTTVTVDHAASRCSSTQRFKGVVGDHARGSFSGRITVRSGTVATDASQSNANLLLCPTAQADTRPWLEIFADDVRCTHGATVGRLDDDALFYLRSRGIPLEESRSMLIDAFVREITDAITPTSLRDHLTASFDAIASGASS
ncbi:MAG: Fe-S cluster assembly protein SufD [Acidimicrobiales bacterium]